MLAPLRRDEHVKWLPRLGYVNDTRRELAHAFKRMPRGENNTFAPRKEATRPNAPLNIRGPETMTDGTFGTDGVV
jgi:hypothetical protein